MNRTGQKFQSDETTLDDVRGGLWGSEPTVSHERSEAAIAEGRPESLNGSGLTFGDAFALQRKTFLAERDPAKSDVGLTA